MSEEKSERERENRRGKFVHEDERGRIDGGLLEWLLGVRDEWLCKGPKVWHARGYKV